MTDPRLAQAGAFLREHLEAAKIVGVTTLVVALSSWTSCTAYKITREAESATREAVAIRETATRFAQQFVPATSGETDEWSRTTEEAAAFGTPDVQRLSLAQTVSRVAEVAGMSGVKASFAPASSDVLAEPRNMGEMTFEPASYGLRLEGSGTVSAVARTVLRLPPSADIGSLVLTGDTNQLTANFHLVVYQPAGGPQN